MKKRMLIASFLLVILLTTAVLAVSQKKLIGDCKKECSLVKRNETSVCRSDYKECRNVCREEKKDCLNETKQNYSECKENCTDRQCVRECAKQKIEEKKQCSKRECLTDCRSSYKNCTEESKGNYSLCKEGCDVNPFEVSGQDCEFYHEICNGPYFDVICSKEKFCICDGDGNYSCPGNYTCSHDIEQFLPRKIHTIEGYKDFLGNDLGDIGVCKKE